MYFCKETTNFTWSNLQDPKEKNLPNFLYAMVLILHINIQRYSWMTAVRQYSIL